MTEKVLHEVLFIETDDGFRIEVKGDKECMKEMFESYMEPIHGMKHGRMKGFRHYARKARRYGRGFMMPPWMWCDIWDDEVEEDEAEPPAASDS